jgi:hypothetical protein
MAYKKVGVYEKFKENPFVEKAIGDMIVRKKTQVMRTGNKDEIQMITNSNGGVEGYSAFMRYVEVDEEKFAKLYLSQLCSFWDLTKASIRVFSYMLSILKPKQDSFILRMNDCLDYTKYKNRKDVMNGIGGLIDSGIIARSEYEFEYFLNPMVVFNGDRVTFAKTYIKKKKSAEGENENQLNLFNQNLIEDFQNGKKEKIQNNSES